ncbi:related to hydrolases or acyltransferases (alpha/beta hydrolase superfamily) [Fusarium mangiferae]|uniref:Related to hydrolases or acyltransferases (Alpha/beta hydrolase superfamily) n=1 Tax=Fusarium mangiferae TaxID=192010 RepID=A0A1L7U1H2_FUSMA|nr:uncharacterized protein FMAN_12771 [Fusarium mangiferae]CVL04660.1 related to hydrolases or acyltransferases (alpha/beta hydrolase superfamily) [Fusarium mangiferae]
MKLINIIPICLFLYCTHATVLPKDDAPGLSRDVQDISPKNRIKWTRCNLGIPEYKELEKNKAIECGTLTVPLDYTKKHSTNTTTLNLIKLKATGKPPKSSIIMNFGGPGASGVEFLLGISPLLSNFIETGLYDIISFDPRGTGKTLVPPDGEGFPLQMFEELSYTAQNSADFFADKSLSDAWDYMSTFTEIFLTKDTDLGRFRGTAFVARDIAEIATALGEGNRINYWGISYGTVLGQVLAGMFPERIERMLLDGNLLVDDYVKNLGVDSTQDAEKALYHFYDECMAAPNDTCHSATKLPKERDDFIKVLDRVFMVCTGVGAGLGRIKSLSMNLWLFASLYHLEGYLKLDDLIDSALEGNRSNCPQGKNPFAELTTPWNPQPELAHLAIWCSDVTFRAETVEEFIDFFDLYEGNRALDDRFFLTTLLLRSVCSRWSIHAAEPINLTSLSRVKTKNPILIVNGEYDPVTPLSHARNISARFPGSQVVVHKGSGHGLLNHFSFCTIGIVFNYFISGELPLEETTCEPYQNAFEIVESLRGLEGKAKIHKTPIFV